MDLCVCGHSKDDHVDLVFGCKMEIPMVEGSEFDVFCACRRFQRAMTEGHGD